MLFDTDFNVVATARKAYDQLEWPRAEMEYWLAIQAYEGMLRAVEQDIPQRWYDAGNSAVRNGLL